MKKLLLALLAILLLLILLVCFFGIPPKSGKFAVGPALPPGKVEPHLVSTWDTAILLAPDGSLWGWGGGQFQLQSLFGKATETSRPVRIGSDSDWRYITGSWIHTLALKDDGSLWGWGWNGSGQLAQPNPKTHFTKPTRIGTDTNWTQISAGAGHALGLRSDGSLWGWGQNEHGQVGDGTKANQFSVTRISPDNDWRMIGAGAFTSYALKSNGTIWGWGYGPLSRGALDPAAPQQIDPGTNWTSMSVGDYELLALKSDGTLWICGQNAAQSAPEYGHGGTGGFMQINTNTDWQSVSAGQSFFFARKRDGSWWVSGQNDRGQLALGGLLGITANGPRKLGIDFEPWAFATGFGNCALLTKDGNLWTWGERLGTSASKSDIREQVKELFNRFAAMLSRRQFGSPARRPIMDNAPYRLWELPGSVRRSLGGTTPLENHDATNNIAGK